MRDEPSIRYDGGEVLGVAQRSGAGPLVRIEADGPVAAIVLDRPERHNALVPDLLDDLQAVIAEVSGRSDVRAVVLAAEGRSFSTGGDVAAFAARAAQGDDALTAYSRRIVGALNDAILDLLALDLPVVVALQGPVTGGSLGLVLAGDVVVAGPRASVAPWYVHVGYSPDGGWTALLPRRVGHGRAGAWQLLNRTVGADEALAAGLVDELHDDPRARADELAREIAGMRPGAVARTRRLLRADLDAVRAGLDAELESFVAQIRTDEARDGMRAFLGRED